jgi:hypothetical protein
MRKTLKELHDAVKSSQLRACSAAARATGFFPKSLALIRKPNTTQQSFVEINRFPLLRERPNFQNLYFIATCGALMFLFPAVANAHDRGAYNAGYERGYHHGYNHGYQDAASGQAYDNRWPDGYDDYSLGVHDGSHAGYDAGYHAGREGHHHHQRDYYPGYSG